MVLLCCQFEDEFEDDFESDSPGPCLSPPQPQEPNASERTATPHRQPETGLALTSPQSGEERVDDEYSDEGFDEDEDETPNAKKLISEVCSNIQA